MSTAEWDARFLSAKVSYCLDRRGRGLGFRVLRDLGCTGLRGLEGSRHQLLSQDYEFSVKGLELLRV